MIDTHAPAALSLEDPLLKELARRDALAEEAGGKERRDRQHAEGKLSARERVILLLDENTFEGWRTRFLELGIAIDAENQWDRGGRSLYVRDPDGHSVELATPGLWETY